MSLKRDIPCLAVGGHEFMRKLEFEDKTKLWDVNETQNDIVWNKTLQHFDLGPDSMRTKEERVATSRWFKLISKS